MVYERGIEYRTAKEAALSDRENHQTAILDAIQRYTSFSEGLAHIRTSMSETLPEKRPSIDTLQIAQKKLESLLPKLTARETSKLNSYLVNGVPAPKSTLLETEQAKKPEVDDDFAAFVRSEIIVVSTKSSVKVPPLSTIESPTLEGGNTPQTIGHAENPRAFFSPFAKNATPKNPNIPTLTL